MYDIVKLILQVTSGVCLVCDRDCDNVYHQLVTCDRLTARRYILYEKLFDHLSLKQYLKIEGCDDHEIQIVTLRGGITPLVDGMSLHTWAQFINIVAQEISSWQLQSILYLKHIIV